jgi:hypothetical protein
MVECSIGLNRLKKFPQCEVEAFNKIANFKSNIYKIEVLLKIEL